MKRNAIYKYIGISLLVLGGLMIQFQSGGESPQKSEPVAASIGNVDTVLTAYEKWKAGYSRHGGDRDFVLALGHSKGLSNEFTRARGKMTLDLNDGSLSVQVKGLNKQKDYDFWLIQDHAAGTAAPEADDRMLRVGTLEHRGERSVLTTMLDRVNLRGFEIDQVALTRSGKRPEEAGLLFGSPNLFQKLYYSELNGLFAQGAQNGGHKSGNGWCFLIPTSAYAEGQNEGIPALLATLIEDGEDLFFNETFGGNGRTCGTCHPAENNFTIDPGFIATLDPCDPLFVAECDRPPECPPCVADLEKPDLMRNFGLILENVDGFEDPTNKFVMRGVPHLFALVTSITPPLSTDPDFSYANATGWSGDGAPNQDDELFGLEAVGSLRDFALGAVRQHFTKSLNRMPGTDFLVPTAEELDAMEAFQLSLGRDENPPVLTGALQFTEPVVQTGKGLFAAQGQCIFCHFDAGAVEIRFRENMILNTGVEDLPDIPYRLFDPTIPRDGGFGREENPPGSGVFGDGRFNIQPLVEAADTPPFFHNNARTTIEDAVDFTNSDEFNNSPGAQSEGVAIDLDQTQVNALAAFLRTLNALENMRNSDELDKKVRDAGFDEISLEDGRGIMNISKADVNDAIQVLKQGPHNLSPDARDHLVKARKKLNKAINAETEADRTFYLQKSINQKKQARNLICTACPF